MLLASSLQREGEDLTSELRSESAARRSLFPGRLCTEGCRVSQLPGANGSRKTSVPAASLITEGFGVSWLPGSVIPSLNDIVWEVIDPKEVQL